MIIRMSRSSDIGRAGMERRVETLAAAGSIPPQIAEAVSQESGHNISTASVRRHLAKQSVNATVPATEEYGAVKRLAAAISGLTDVRDTDISSYFGKYKLNTTNNFTQYYGIARGIGNGQVSRAFKNIALKITSGARIVGDERDADRIDALSKAINFSSLLQNVVRYTCEMGTCLVGMTSKDVYV
ncbi:MAG: hypothetical protein U9R21_03715, partial [Candidatus Thermoplasmatota archaeon]|nr:hypothetical protein [Candidatus Thermoplasmatota archaeon]